MKQNYTGNNWFIYNCNQWHELQYCKHGCYPAHRERNHALNFGHKTIAQKLITLQDRQALLKAKYCPRVSAAARTQKNTKKPT